MGTDWEDQGQDARAPGGPPPARPAASSLSLSRGAVQLGGERPAGHLQVPMSWGRAGLQSWGGRGPSAGPRGWEGQCRSKRR